MRAKIAIQEGLEQLKEMLVQAGYQVVNMEKTIEPVDAMVYSGVTCDWEGGMSVENVEMTLNGSGIEQNVLMVNVAEMTQGEAFDLINTRV